MAAAVTSIMRDDTQTKEAYETFSVVLGAADTTAVITPTNIKAIDHVEITPANAAAASNGGYVTTFAPGSATVTLTSANSTEFFVTVFGRVA